MLWLDFMSRVKYPNGRSERPSASKAAWIWLASLKAIKGQERRLHMGCLLLSGTVIYRWISQSNQLMTLLEAKQLRKKD